MRLRWLRLACWALSVPFDGFGGEFAVGCEVELGVDVGEVGLYGAGRAQESFCDFGVGEAVFDEGDDLGLGGGQAGPAGGGPFAFAASPTGVGDGFVEV